MTDNCRVFVNEKTFEYDLALESHHNANIMLNIILENLTTNGSIRTKTEKFIHDINDGSDIDVAEMAGFILKQVDSSSLGKGLFAQLLYEKIDEEFGIPEYIINAINFMLRIES